MGIGIEERGVRMDIVKLKSQIKSGKLDNLYIFVGEEIGLMNLYIGKMSNEAHRVDSVAGVWKRLTSRGLQSGKPFYVVRDDKEFLQAEKVWSVAEKMIKYGTLVLLYTNLDKRSRFYKEFEHRMVIFDKMTRAQLVKFVMSQFPERFKVDEGKAEYLCEACNDDYTQLIHEIDKLTRLMEGPDGIFHQVGFKKAVDEVVRAPKYADTFSMANHVMQYHAKQAVEQMQFLLDNGESGIGMITVLYNNFRNAVQVLSSTASAKEISEKYGIHIAAVTNILNNFDYSMSGAIKAMQILQDAESGIKNGKYAEDKAPMIALCRILNLE